MAIPIFPTRGVNLLTDPRRIEDDECVWAKNLVPVRPGILKKRRPARFSEPLGSINYASVFGGPIGVVQHPEPSGPLIYLYYSLVTNGGAAWTISTAYEVGNYSRPSTGGIYICVVAGTSSGVGTGPTGLTGYIVDGTAIWARADFLQAGTGIVTDDLQETATSFQTANLLGYNPEPPVGFAYQRSYYVLPGYPSATAGWKIDFNTGTRATTISTYSFLGTNNGFSPSAVGVYRDRTVYGNFGPGYENHIVFSDPYQPALIGNDVRAANGRSFTVGSGEGDKIIAIVPITQSEVGNASSESLLILKEFSAYIITGEPDQTITSGSTRELMFGDMTTSKISYDCGCSSARTVTSTPYGLFWAGWDDVWFFAKGALPVRVGTKIRPALAASPADLRYKWHAAYHDGFYRLAVFADGQGPDNSSPCGDQWWMDLRNGPSMNAMECQWWGPQVFAVPPRYNILGTTPGTLLGSTGYGTSYGTFSMYRDERTGYPVKLFGIARNQYSYYLAGAFRMEFDAIGTMDLYDYLTGVNVEPLAHGFGGTAIEFELLTKEYDFDEARKLKCFLGLEADVWSSISDYLRLRIIAAGGAVIEEASDLVEIPGINLGVDLLDINISREFQQVAIWPDPTTSKVGSTFQFKLYDLAGYTLDSNSDLLIVNRTAGTVGVIVQLAQGYYASFFDLLEHIKAMLNAQVGGGYTFTHNWTTNYYPNRPTDGTWTLTGSSAFTLQFITGVLAGATAAQLARARGAGAILGLATGADSSNATTKVSEVGIYAYRTGDWEIGDLAVNMRLFERSPS